MKIITEYKDKDVPQTKDAIYINAISIKDFNRGEAAGIYLRDLKYNTICLIESLLYYKHPVTLKYGDKQYKLYTKDDWRCTYQDPKDQLKTKTERHVILEEYLNKRKEAREFKNTKSLRAQYNMLLEFCDFPDNEELEAFLRDTAPLYDVDVDYEDNISKYRAYIQLKYYLEHDFEYSNPANKVEVLAIGREDYLENIIYREQEL